MVRQTGALLAGLPHSGGLRDAGAALFLAGVLVGAILLNQSVAQNARVHGLNHVGMVVPDYDKAFAYYTGKLGFREAYTIRRPDGSVQFATPFVEMGQGVHTALALLVAEEMEIGPTRVRPVQAPHDAIYGNVAMFVGSLPLHPTSTEPGDWPKPARKLIQT